MQSGAVRCWGKNHDGQIGDGTTVDRQLPVAIGLTEARLVSAGGLHTCAVLRDGSAKCWGINVDGELGDGTNVSRSVPGAVLGLN